MKRNISIKQHVVIGFGNNYLLRQQTTLLDILKLYKSDEQFIIWSRVFQRRSMVHYRFIISTRKWMWLSAIYHLSSPTVYETQTKEFLLHHPDISYKRQNILKSENE